MRALRRFSTVRQPVLNVLETASSAHEHRNGLHHHGTSAVTFNAHDQPAVMMSASDHTESPTPVEHGTSSTSESSSSSPTATAAWLHEDINDYKADASRENANEDLLEKEMAKQSSVREMLQLHARRSDELTGTKLIQFWLKVGRLTAGASIRGEKPTSSANSAAAAAERRWIFDNLPLLEPATKHLEKQMPSLSTWELSGVARALAMTRVPAHPIQALWKKLASHITDRSADFDDKGLLSMLDACSRAGRTGPGIFSVLTQEAAGRTADGQSDRFEPHQYHSLLRSCTRVNFRSQPLLIACAAGLHRKLDEVPLHVLVDIGWAYAVHNHRPLSIFGENGMFIPRLLEGIEEMARQRAAVAEESTAAGAEAGEEGEEIDEDDEDDATSGKRSDETPAARAGRMAARNASLGGRIHQWRLWLDHERKSADAASGIAPDSALGQRMLADYVALQRRGTSGKQAIDNCRQALLELGYTPEQRVTRFGHVLDLVVQVDGTDVALEVETPKGIAQRSRSNGRTYTQPTGWFALRHRQLRWVQENERGETLLPVSLADMRPPGETADERQERRRKFLEGVLKAQAKPAHANA